MKKEFLHEKWKTSQIALKSVSDGKFDIFFFVKKKCRVECSCGFCSIEVSSMWDKWPVKDHSFGRRSISFCWIRYCRSVNDFDWWEWSISNLTSRIIIEQSTLTAVINILWCHLNRFRCVNAHFVKWCTQLKWNRLTK